MSEANYDAATPEELAKELVDSMNSHGLSDEDCEIHNRVKMTVDLTGKTHRGKMTECVPGVLREARRAGWQVAGINYDSTTVMLEVEGWADR